MFNGVSHVDVPVRDLGRAVHLYRDVLGFPVDREGEGFVDLNAATCSIRLVRSDAIERPASLRVSVMDVDEGVRRLAAAGATVLYRPDRTAHLTVEGTVRDEDGNTLTIWRALSEDEYGFDPELPKERVWDEDAELLLKSLLRAVPALFRALARRKVVREAERRVGANGRITRDLAIRSYISAQAPPNRQRLHAPLRAHGIESTDYRDEFES